MKLLNLKYKMHKLVNLVFYLIVFGIGFLLGFGADKINVNKIIGQILFIDNVSAATIYENLDEQKLYDKFVSTFEDFDIDEHPYVYCDNYLKYDPTERITRCYALEKTFLPNFFPYGDTHIYFSNNGTLYSFYYLWYEHITNTWVNSGYLYNQDRFGIFFAKGQLHYEFNYYSNFDFKELTEEENSLYNVLNFSNCESENGCLVKDEEVYVDIVNNTFYEFSQKIFGEVSEENKFIYDFITFGLVATCFTLFVLIVGYIFNKIFGG